MHVLRRFSRAPRSRIFALSNGCREFTADFLVNQSGPTLAIASGMREVDRVTGEVIGAAIRVHKKYGPGLMESVYKPVLGHELVALGLRVEIDKPLSLEHEDLKIHRAYILDLLVEGQVIVEIKCVKQIAPIHTSQLLTYLRLTGLEVGIILNFNVRRLADGIKRVVNDYQEERDDL